MLHLGYDFSQLGAFHRAVMRSQFLLAICLLAAGTASARDIYVDNLSGDDSLNGIRPIATSATDGPVRTLTKALRIALQGDRIVLSQGSMANRPADESLPIGIYRESVTLVGERHSGFRATPLIIEGNGAVLDGSSPVPDEAWEQVQGDLYRFQPPRMAYQQLFIAGRPIARKRALTTEGALPELRPLEWCLAGGYAYLCVEPTKMPQEYGVSFADLTVGITLYKVHDVDIRNLTIQGFQLDGINAHDGVRRTRLLNLTSRGNGRSGVCISGGSRVELTGVTLGDNGEAQLLLEGYSHTHVFDSTLIENDMPAILRRGNDELFVDAVLVPGKT